MTNWAAAATESVRVHSNMTNFQRVLRVWSVPVFLHIEPPGTGREPDCLVPNFRIQDRTTLPGLAWFLSAHLSPIAMRDLYGDGCSL